MLYTVLRSALVTTQVNRTPPTLADVLTALHVKVTAGNFILAIATHIDA